MLTDFGHAEVTKKARADLLTLSRDSAVLHRAKLVG